MSDLRTINRVTVYADSMLSDSLIEQFLALGSKGYTVIGCAGQGEHRAVDDPFGPASKFVRIELLVPPPVADRIMHYLKTHERRQRSIAMCVEDVKVLADENF